MGNVNTRRRAPSAASTPQSADPLCGGGASHAKLVTGPVSNYASLALVHGDCTPPTPIAGDVNAVSVDLGSEARSSGDTRRAPQSAAERRFALGHLSRWTWCIIAMAIAMTCVLVVVAAVGVQPKRSPASDSLPRQVPVWVDLPSLEVPTCTSLEGLTTDWICYGDPRDEPYYLTTSPSLYKLCDLTKTEEEGQRWALECYVNCELIGIATQQQRPPSTALFNSTNISIASSEEWTAPEHLARLCAAAAQEKPLVLPSDYLSIHLAPAHISGSKETFRVPVANVSYALETGLTSVRKDMLGLFEFAMDHEVSCSAYTGSDTCSAGGQHIYY